MVVDEAKASSSPALSKEAWSMINLLPPKEKEEILKEENWKLLMILGMILLFFLISLLLILFSIKIFIVGEVEAQKIIFAEREKEFKSTQMQNLQNNLTAFNKKLSQLDSFYQNQSNFSEILEEISKTLPSGVYLNNLSIVSQGGKNEGSGCSISGFSPSRQILLVLKDNLEKEKNFQEVYFPSSNWVKPADINFTISLKIK